jgi:hypothetical protein
MKLAEIAFFTDKVCEQLIEQGLMLEIPPQDFYWVVPLIYGIRMGIK